MHKKPSLSLLLLLIIGVFFSIRMIADNKAIHYINEDNSDLNIEPFTPQEEDITKNQAIEQTIMMMINSGHYSPKAINDDFSKKVFDKYIEISDYGKLFLIQSDIDELKKYEYLIDDEIKQGKTEFYDLVSARIKQRIAETDTFYKEALLKPFDFNGNEVIELDGKKLNWAENKEALKNRWYLSMKYRALARFEELKEQQKKASDKKEKDKTDAQLEIDARESVKKNMEFYFKRLNKISDTDRFASYMNSICHVVDPHTDFFPPKDKQRFDEEMSGKFFGIGAVLQNEDGNCKIKSIVVGSPCWKEGHLKVGDVILKVAQQNEDPVEISGWDIEEIVSIIRGKDGSLVTLTVKHLDGSVEEIIIKRGKVEREETFAKSSIIKEGNSKIGYILLPEFYADFQDAGGRRCATDMKIEINKLKDENVDGIIVDLRNNGGGSLTDVVEIGGLFVNKGPMVQVKSKSENAQSMNVRSSEALYNGPLVILINQASASASEILAAAMQDYKRAIIMGSTSFGKGTVQRVFPIDDFFQGDRSLLPFGSLKLTLQKFYRINGGSTQLKGVTPDIKIPDLYHLIDIGERKDSNSLVWDQIAKVDYKPLTPSVDFQDLISKSTKRINSDPTFDLINKNAIRVKKQSEDNKYSLNRVKFVEQMKEAKEFSKKLEDIEKSKKTLAVNNLKKDLSNIQKDTSSITKNNEWLKTIKKDPYIIEASNVVLDWIKASKQTNTDAVLNKKG